MNRSHTMLIGLAIAGVAGLGLGGCASTASVTSSAQADTASYEVDTAKVAAVERAAQRYGIGLVWVSKPMKKTVATIGS